MSTLGFEPDGIGGRKLSQAECDALHFEMNGPVPIKINGKPLTFPAYAYRPYPAAVYGIWTEERKRRALLDTARAYGLDLTKPLERAEAESRVPKWDCEQVENDRQHQDYLNKGWTDNPDEVDKAHDAYIANTVAVAAAEQKYSDRNMSEKAKEEFHAADRASGDQHLVDLPAGKLNKKRGRPAKTPSAA